MINRDKMDPLLKFTEEDCIQPSELLFKELDKVLHKVSIHSFIMFFIGVCMQYFLACQTVNNV